MASTFETKPLSSTAGDYADQAASKADSAIKSTQKMANDALDTLSDKVDDIRSQAAPTINRLATKAEDAARRGIAAVKDTTQQLRDKANQATDTTVTYIKDDPIKAMLIAAATGAALMALLSLMGRSRD
ncbi:MAG: hypothetical protein ABIO45_15880 [Burkholderiaceae bacterium]